MSKLSKKDILHVAKLAKLKLSETEISKFSQQLSEVVTYVEVLDEVEVINIKPTSQTTGLISVFREDKTKTEKSLKQKEALSGSDKTHNGYFIAKAVLNEARMKK